MGFFLIAGMHSSTTVNNAVAGDYVEEPSPPASLECLQLAEFIKFRHKIMSQIIYDTIHISA